MIVAGYEATHADGAGPSGTPTIYCGGMPLAEYTRIRPWPQQSGALCWRVAAGRDGYGRELAGDELARARELAGIYADSCVGPRYGLSPAERRVRIGAVA